jgi:hypothetical protein
MSLGSKTAGFAPKMTISETKILILLRTPPFGEMAFMYFFNY